MPLRATQSVLTIGLLLGCCVSATFAQAPAGGGTLWQFLGIPQGLRYMRDNTLNRSGNRPGLERKPPLTPIGDPKNLQSKDASIKKAAEVKQAEDMKKQKIKAIKYLASIGCGCYNRDGSITDALVKSMDDCTEEVRLATVQAISEAAVGEKCANCKMKSCCSEEISNKLYEIAYGRDENGCYLEPSERVRLAAAEGLRTCCEGRDDMIMMEGPTTAPPVGGEQPTLAPEVGGERPSGAPPVLIDPSSPVPLQNPQPTPAPTPLIPPRAAPPAPAPAAFDSTQTSRRTAMIKGQPARTERSSENSVVIKQPLPAATPAYDAPAPAQVVTPIRVTPHWTPASAQLTVFLRESVRGPFPLDDTVVHPTPETVVVASLPDRNQLVASQPGQIDETLGLAPIVSPETVTRRLPPVESSPLVQFPAQFIPSSRSSSANSPVVLPASVQKPRRNAPVTNEPSHESAAPVLTSDVSLDQPVKPARPKPAAPRQIPGAEFGAGTVTSIKIKENTAIIEFNTDASLPAGSILRAYHQYALVAKKAVCDLQVIESENGKTIAVAYGRSQLSDLTVGDRTFVLQ